MNTVDVEITIRRGSRRNAAKHAPAESTAATPRIPRITRLMALAIKFQDMVDRGEVRDYADLARLGFVTRARLTQIMNLLLLAPDVQGATTVCRMPRRCRSPFREVPAFCCVDSRLGNAAAPNE